MVPSVLLALKLARVLEAPLETLFDLDDGCTIPSSASYEQHRKIVVSAPPPKLGRGHKPTFVKSCCAVRLGVGEPDLHRLRAVVRKETDAYNPNLEIAK